jgi:hypothetical protein
MEKEAGIQSEDSRRAVCWIVRPPSEEQGMGLAGEKIVKVALRPAC